MREVSERDLFEDLLGELESEAEFEIDKLVVLRHGREEGSDPGQGIAEAIVVQLEHVNVGIDLERLQSGEVGQREGGDTCSRGRDGSHEVTNCVHYCGKGSQSRDRKGRNNEADLLDQE